MTADDTDCREYVSRMLTPTMVARRLEVIPRRVNQLAHMLDLGIVVGHLRLFTEEEVLEMERWRSDHKYGKGRTPRERIKEPPPLSEVTLSPAYRDAVRKLRGEKES